MSPENERWSRDHLPRPFSLDPWRSERREAAEAFWNWHQALGSSSDNNIQEVKSAALSMCRRFKLDEADVLAQESAASRLTTGFRVEDAQALDEFVDDWTAAHGRLLAGLAETGRYEWQKVYVHAMARGFFLTAGIMVLPEDIAKDRLLFPMSDLTQIGVGVDELKQGYITPPVKKLLWKQSVRARDSFAQAQPLIDDLNRRHAASFRRWWFAGLEMLNVIESSGFDVWSRMPGLTLYRRLHVRFQARFGRTTFR